MRRVLVSVRMYVLSVGFPASQRKYVTGVPSLYRKGPVGVNLFPWKYMFGIPFRAEKNLKNSLPERERERERERKRERKRNLLICNRTKA